MINYAASFGAKNLQKTTSEAAEMLLGPWNQETRLWSQKIFEDIKLPVPVKSCRSNRCFMEPAYINIP